MPGGRGCGSRSPEGGAAPALALSQSNRFVNKPSHSLLATSSLLKLFSLFVKHFHVPGNCGPRSSLGEFRRPAPGSQGSRKSASGGPIGGRRRDGGWVASAGWFSSLFGFGHALAL